MEKPHIHGQIHLMKCSPNDRVLRDGFELIPSPITLRSTQLATKQSILSLNLFRIIQFSRKHIFCYIYLNSTICENIYSLAYFYLPAISFKRSALPPTPPRVCVRMELPIVYCFRTSLLHGKVLATTVILNTHSRVPVPTMPIKVLMMGACG